jgi:iron complex outermembrane recepter protein
MRLRYLQTSPDLPRGRRTAGTAVRQRLELGPKAPIAAAVSLVLLTGPDVRAAETETPELATIVVTANRRQEDVRDVPYNISALDGQLLEASGAKSLVDVARLTPGIVVSDLGTRGNGTNSLITIRGLNINDPVYSSFLPWGSVPTVSTYVDDVPQYVNLQLSDIQRVEVLRGPQGTLYGSGAAAGTIKILHNPPDLRVFSAQAATEVSSTDRAGNPSYSVRGVINVPLTDAVGFRLSGGYDKAAGFIDAPKAAVYLASGQPALANPADPLNSGLTFGPLRDIDDASTWHARAAILWKPSSAAEVTFAYQRQQDRSSGFSRATAGNQFETLALVPHEPETRTVDVASILASVDLGFATISSSTSYTKNDFTNVADTSEYIIGFNAVLPTLYGNYPRITSLYDNRGRDASFSQELRLLSQAGGAWEYAVGAFFQHNTSNTYQRQSIPGIAAWSELPGSASVVSPDTPGGPYATFGDYVQFYNGGTRPSALSPVDTNFTFQRTSGFIDRAVFGELTRRLTPQWQVTAGARLFWQDFSQGVYSTIPYGGPFNSTLPPPANSTDALGTTVAQRELGFRDHIFKINTSYALTDTTRIYATVSEGFRHGGVNAVPVGQCFYCESESLVPYRSDTTRNYEVGVKGTVANVLRYTAALYRVDWKDLQIQGFGQGGYAIVFNGKNARSQGLELEADARLSPAWAVSLGYSFTDAKITNDFTVTEPIPNSADLYTLITASRGDQLPYVPRHALSAAVNYSHKFRPGLAMDANVNAAYRSEVRTQLNETAVGYRVLSGFTTVNASVGVEIGSNWRVHLFVNNIGNVRGVMAAGPQLRLFDLPEYRLEYVTRPRTVGLGLQYTY